MIGPPRAHMRWTLTGRKYRLDGRLVLGTRNYLIDPAARGVDTPAGFYQNEGGVRSTLEERYYGHRGIKVVDIDVNKK